MQSSDYHPQGGWSHKFANAFRGIRSGMLGQSSFLVHCIVAVVVIAAGILFRLGQAQWCLLLLCIGFVMTAELFNSSLETMAKTIDRGQNADLGKALDIASGAVLLGAITAATVGLIIFLGNYL